MIKKSLFRKLDIIIYLNVFIFVGSAFSVIKENLVIPIIFFLIAVINIVYLIVSIKNRIKLAELNENRIKLELEMEKVFKENENIDIDEIKRKMLESRIESQVKVGFPNAKIIKNLEIPSNKKDKTFIDFLVLDLSGIFIIKLKDITGTIKSNWDNKVIKLEHPGGKSYNLKNPINENTSLFFALKNFLGLNHNYFRNIVVFGENTYISTYKGVPYFARVCKVEQLTGSMNRLALKYKTTLEQSELEVIYKQLTKTNKANNLKEKK